MGNNASNAIFAASGYNMDKAEVRCDDFWTVVGKDKVTINNTKDRKKRFVLYNHFVSETQVYIIIICKNS